MIHTGVMIGIVVGVTLCWSIIFYGLYLASQCPDCGKEGCMCGQERKM